MDARKNLSQDEIAELIDDSLHKAVRRITDPRSGEQWYWKAEDGTHAEGAAQLGIPYDLRPGEGDLLVT